MNHSKIMVPTWYPRGGLHLAKSSECIPSIVYDGSTHVIKFFFFFEKFLQVFDYSISLSGAMQRLSMPLVVAAKAYSNSKSFSDCRQDEEQEEIHVHERGEEVVASLCGHQITLH